METPNFDDNLLILTCFNLFFIAAAGHVFLNKRRHGCWVRGYLYEEGKKVSAFNSLLKDLSKYDNVKLKNYLRMDMESFEEILALVDKDISTRSTKFRYAIPF